MTFDAPMRVAPTVHDGRVYVGCDDGYAYALQATSGALIWEKEVSPVERGFLNDGRLCSQQTVRTGILIDPRQKCAIVAAGIFPGSVHRWSACRWSMAAKYGDRTWGQVGRSMTGDNELLHGPGNKDGWITTSNASTREKIASFTGGTAAVVDGDRAYLLSPSSLTCIDQRAGQLLWRSSLQCPHEVILVGDTLFTGGDDVIAAISAESGQLL